VKTPASAATLHTTSEGLWLAGALAGGVAALPPALRIRPVRAVADTVTTHPGLTSLQAAGALTDDGIRPDIRQALQTLGRPDIEIDILISRPDDYPSRLLGPPPLPDVGGDVERAALALAQWHRTQPPQRVIALCRRDGLWASAARLWHPGDDSVDEVTVTGLGDANIICAPKLFGHREHVRFGSFTVNTPDLFAVLGDWQTQPDFNLTDGLRRLELTDSQAQIMAVVADAGTTRSAVTASQHTIDGQAHSPLTFVVADTMLGRALINNEHCNGKNRTTVSPGTDEAIKYALTSMLNVLPSGCGWLSHRRLPLHANA
jgi:EspG family